MKCLLPYSRQTECDISMHQISLWTIKMKLRQNIKIFFCCGKDLKWKLKSVDSIIQGLVFTSVHICAVFFAGMDFLTLLFRKNLNR